MPAAKKEEPPPPKSLLAVAIEPVVKLLRQSAGRWLVGLVLLAAGIGAGLYAAWEHVGPAIRRNEDYILTTEKITITTPPEWIRADVRVEALRDAGLDGPLSLFDEPKGPTVVERLAEAFALHPWVAAVERVQKFHPARVEVQLRYRSPVAMVEVPRGLYPVDGEGVVLPTADFRQSQSSQDAAQQYPRIGSIGSYPLGLVGTKWGDARVHGAARIAALFDDGLWASLQLGRIVASEGSEAGSDVAPQFEIFTQRGTRIYWGHAPGSETDDEVKVEEKLSRLQRYVSKYGSLDAPQERQELDVRPWSDMLVRPYSARRDRATPR